MNVNTFSMIAAAVVAPLALSNCVIALECDSPTQGKELTELHEARANGAITQSEYQSKKSEIMKNGKP